MAPPEQREPAQARSLLRWLRDAKTGSRRRGQESEEDAEIPKFGSLSPHRVGLIQGWLCSGRVRWPLEARRGDEDDHVAWEEGGHVAEEEETVELEKPFTMVVNWAENERMESERWNRGRRSMNLSAELAGVEEVQDAGKEEVHMEAHAAEVEVPDVPEIDTLNSMHESDAVCEINQRPMGEEEAKPGDAQESSTVQLSGTGDENDVCSHAEGSSPPQQQKSEDGGSATAMARDSCRAPRPSEPDSMLGEMIAPRGAEGAASELEGAASELEGAVSELVGAASELEGASQKAQKVPADAARGISPAEPEGGRATAGNTRDGVVAEAGEGVGRQSSHGMQGGYDDCVVEYLETGGIRIPSQEAPEPMSSFQGRRAAKVREMACVVNGDYSGGFGGNHEHDLLPETPCSIEPAHCGVRPRSGPLQNKKSRLGAASGDDGARDDSDPKTKKKSKSGPLPSKPRRAAAGVASTDAASSSNVRGSLTSQQVNACATSPPVSESFMASSFFGLRTSCGPVYVPKHLSKRLSMPERSSEIVSPSSAQPPQAHAEDLTSPTWAAGRDSVRRGAPKEGRAGADRSTRRKKKSMSAPIQGRQRKVPDSRDSPADLAVTVPPGKPGWMSNSAPLYTRRKPKSEDRGNTRDREQEEEDARVEGENPCGQNAEGSRLAHAASRDVGVLKTLTARSLVTKIELWLCGLHRTKEGMRRQGSRKEGRGETNGSPRGKSNGMRDREGERSGSRPRTPWKDEQGADASRKEHVEEARDRLGRKQDLIPVAESQCTSKTRYRHEEMRFESKVAQGVPTRTEIPVF